VKVFVYARCSTDDMGQNPESQLLACRNFAALYKHEVVGEFIDNGVSGDTVIWQRPAGKQLDAALKAGKAQGLICFSVDRFSRQNPFKVNELLQGIKREGVTFISVSEPIFSSDNEFSEVMQFMMTWFGAYYLTKQKKAIKTGIVRFKATNGRWGRKPLSGWHRKRVIEARKQGKSIRAIASELELSVGVVHKTLHIQPDVAILPQSDVRITDVL